MTEYFFFPLIRGSTRKGDGVLYFAPLLFIHPTVSPARLLPSTGGQAGEPPPLIKGRKEMLGIDPVARERRG
jgi:hypothetical protein